MISICILFTFIENGVGPWDRRSTFALLDWCKGDLLSRDLDLQLKVKERKSLVFRVDLAQASLVNLVRKIQR